MLVVVPQGSTLEKGEKEGLIALVVIRPVFILSMHPSDQHLALHCALLRVYVLLWHEVRAAPFAAAPCCLRSCLASS